MKDYGALKYEQWGPNPKYGGRHVQRPEPQHKDVNTTLSPEQLSNVGVLSQKPISSREFGKFSGLPGDVGSVKAVGPEEKEGVRDMLKRMIFESLGIPKGLSGSYDIESGDAKIGYEWPTN